jgi:hypothetical protein
MQRPSARPVGGMSVRLAVFWDEKLRFDSAFAFQWAKES